MNDPKIDELCQRIYKNHRRALELIFARVGAPGSGVLAEAKTLVRDDPRWHVFYETTRYIAFVPKDWLEWLPRLGTSDDPHSWIALQLYGREKMLEFIVQVRPMQDVAKRKQITDQLIKELPKRGFKEALGGKPGDTYTRVSGSDRVLEWNKGDEPEPEVVRAAVQKKLDEVFSKLKDVPAVLKQVLGLPSNP